MLELHFTKLKLLLELDLTHNTPTDLPCEWNQTFTRSILGSPVPEIDVYSEESKAKLTKPPKPLQAEPSGRIKNEFFERTTPS